jgi:ribosomal protein S18 acetylase RimI-like enzyme
VLLIDQAYREYMPPGSVEGAAYVARRPATIVLRTMSKIYGFASLRFGYALGDPELLSYAERVRVPFGVSRPAAVAALAALDDREFLERSVATNEAGKAMLYPAFDRLGLHAFPTAANFVAVRVPSSVGDPYEEMLRRGIVTRSGTALGMPGRLRITIGAPADNARCSPHSNRWSRRPREARAGRGTVRRVAGDREFVRDLAPAQRGEQPLGGPRRTRGGRRSRSNGSSTFVYEREHVALIGELGGRRVGFLLLVFDIPDEVTLTEQAFIAYAAVEPDARGRGVGRALLDAAEQHAREAGLRYVSLMVTDDNAPARALYDGPGFSPSGEC